MRRSAARVRARGFTLIEITAVVFLMALVTAAVLPSLSQRSDEVKRSQLVAELIDLDARARLLATGHDACFLGFDKTTEDLVLTVVVDAQSMVLRRVAIPKGVSVSIRSSIQSIVFDRAGHTTSYGYLISSDGVQTTLRFNGLTGWQEIDREDSN